MRADFYFFNAAINVTNEVSTLTSRPNILFIISDQWTASILDNALAGTGPQIPSLLRLAREGIRFRHNYCTFPLCVPARASIFTGSMPSETMAVSNRKAATPDGRVPSALPRLGRLLHDGGYETAHFGKDHSAGTVSDGIDNFGSKRYDSAGYLADGCLLDPVFTRDAVAFLEREHEQPFFLTCSLINPHDICMTPPTVGTPSRTIADITDVFRWDLTYLRQNDLPPLPANHNAPIPQAMDAMRKHASVPDWNEDQWRCFLASYWLLIENTDALIGQVLVALDRNGLAENTLVIFTSDHGDQSAAHGRVGKGYLFEESARTPLIMRLPGTTTPGVEDKAHFTSGADILPTFCDAAGLDVPKLRFGRSLMPLLRNAEPDDWRPYVACETRDGRMIRFGDYKYIRYENPDRTEFLYDLGNDPGETRNLMDDTEYQAALEQGRRFLDDYYKTIGATIESTLTTD